MTDLTTATSAAVPSGASRERVADLWDDVIGRWLAGDESLSPDLQRWKASYAGMVDERWFPDPVVGDLRGLVAEPRMVVLGLNPGVGYAQLQSREGIWADKIRASSYTRSVERNAFDDPDWLRCHGRPSPYWSALVRFGRRWTGQESLTPAQILNFELYPWHSDRVEAPIRPPADLLDAYIWQPVAEVETPHVFAFGAPWERVCLDLGWDLLERYGPSHGSVPGADLRGWNLAIFGMPSGQKAVVSWQAGYAGPPGLLRTEQLRAVLNAERVGE